MRQHRLAGGPAALCAGSPGFLVFSARTLATNGSGFFPGAVAPIGWRPCRLVDLFYLLGSRVRAVARPVCPVDRSSRVAASPLGAEAQPGTGPSAERNGRNAEAGGSWAAVLEPSDRGWSSPAKHTTLLGNRCVLLGHGSVGRRGAERGGKPSRFSLLRRRQKCCGGFDRTAATIDFSLAKRCDYLNEEPEQCQWDLGLSDAE